jgi:hypothetical protein|tara:strand:- start:1707 stop:2618 length:912 start_codon:yes stop_codon:yes gene_type:complete
MPKVEKLEDRRVFEVDGVKYAVRRPTMQELTKANEMRRKTFNEELAAGTMLRDQLDEELRKRKLWSDDRESRYQILRQEVIDGEYKLAKGGISLSDAKEIAISMRRKRSEMVEMLSSRTDLDSNTCEGKADSVRFNFLFANCLVYNDTDEQFFKNGLGDYLLNQEDPVAGVGATEFFYLISDSDDVDSKLAENKFLKKYKFANEDYNLVDDNGRLVDTEGKHIDEFGNYIKWTSDTEFVKVDVNGRPLNEDGDFEVEFEGFLDDSGKVIDESDYSDRPKPEKVKAEEKPKPKRRTRKKAEASA